MKENEPKTKRFSERRNFMVYYITTPEHLGLMQKICEERKDEF